MITSVVSNGVELLADGFDPEPEWTRQSSFLATGLTGWVDCFPAIAPDPPGAELDRADLRIPDHGELWFRAWDVVAAAPASATLRCTIPQWRSTATKTVQWIGDALEVTSCVSNAGDAAIPYVLASHPLFSCDSTSWLALPNGSLRWESSAGWPLEHPELDGLWPADSAGRRWWRDIPPRSFAKVFMTWPPDGITFGFHGQTWALQWPDAAPDGFIGLWINNDGLPNDHSLQHWAPEPTIGSSDSVHHAGALGTSGLLAPGHSVTMTVRVVPVT